MRYTHISAKHKILDLKLNEVWQYRDLIFLFTQRNFVTLYKQTILGPIWLFVSPIMTSIMSVIMFGNIAKLGTDGIPQILFYMAGNAIWGYFSSCLTGNASTFTGNAGLFGKVYFARLTVPLSNILSNCIRFGMQMIVVVILMIYYTAIGSIEMHPLRWLLIPLILLVFGMMGMGCGILASSLTTKYRDLSVLISFGVSLWMYATPVIYPLSQLAGSPFLGMALWNPVTAPVELFRYALFGVGTIWLPGLAVSLIFTTVVLFLGIIVFNQIERTFMDTV